MKNENVFVHNIFCFVLFRIYMQLLILRTEEMYTKQYITTIITTKRYKNKNIQIQLVHAGLLANAKKD